MALRTCWRRDGKPEAVRSQLPLSTLCDPINQNDLDPNNAMDCRRSPTLLAGLSRAHVIITTPQRIPP